MKSIFYRSISVLFRHTALIALTLCLSSMAWSQTTPAQQNPLSNPAIDGNAVITDTDGNKFLIMKVAPAGTTDMTPFQADVMLKWITDASNVPIDNNGILRLSAVGDGASQIEILNTSNTVVTLPAEWSRDGQNNSYKRSADNSTIAPGSPLTWKVRYKVGETNLNTVKLHLDYVGSSYNTTDDDDKRPTINVIPVKIKQVYETDQTLNEAPNPRQPDYANNEGDSETIFKRLYCSVEPETGKAEITVKLDGAGSSDGKLMCCLEYNGTLTTPPIAFDSTGKAGLSVTPLGNLMSDSIHKVRVGYDANGNGSLEASELAPVESKPFTVGIATTDDRDIAFGTLNLASVLSTIAGRHVSVFTAKTNALPNAISPHGETTQSVTVKNPTLIAGSSYSGSQGGGGTTTIPKFHIPAQSDDSNYIADRFNSEANYGLHGLVNQAWTENLTTINNTVGQNNGSEAWVNLPLAGKSINFYYSITVNPLRAAFGSATCLTGTAKILCKRTSNGIQAKTIELTCTIYDLYDFDVTRPSSSLSRKGSVAQLGWEPAQRPQGRIFFVLYDIVRTYDESTVLNDENVIGFFNQNISSYVPPTNSE